LTHFWEVALFTSIGFLTVGAGATYILVGLRKFVFARNLEPTPEWLEKFDLTRYEALIQLLAPQDFEFLRTQPGYTPQLAARLKSDRLAIARSYLDELQTDFRLLLNFANKASAQGVIDADDFSAFLLKQEFRFAVTVTRFRCELALMRIGVNRRIEFERLLDTVRPLVQCSRTFALQAS
jgi:hypothetical protein